jgi:DUF1680 family protein
MTTTAAACRALPRSDVRLLPGLFHDRFACNRRYVTSLQTEGLLQNFYLEAGLRAMMDHPGADLSGRHQGWESPTCQIRGHFLGHWLSAAAQMIAHTGDPELKQRADAVVAELATCQARNGGGWVGSTPEKLLTWLAQGVQVWAPQYVHHKTLMGLHDMAVLAGNAQALQIADAFADWFHRWSGGFTEAQLDDILDVETGGMLEAWANLYAATGAEKYRDLMARYTRRRLFEPLLAGDDMLTNMHANTTVPEAHGVARCYEVTGDPRYRAMAEAYWRCAVTDRGTFCTGGQTSGEIWTPPFAFAARRGEKTQEHCFVYNMIRLADYLYRWSGDAAYLDYIERNLYNGILAQQHPGTGMVAYFLPLQAGAKKVWGHPTQDFWCCHGTLVQAHSGYPAWIYYAGDDGLTVGQYIPSEATVSLGGTAVTVRQEFDTQAGGTQALTASAAVHQPFGRTEAWRVRLTVRCAPADFTLTLRIPAWVQGAATVAVNGAAQSAGPGLVALRRTWADDEVVLTLPKAITAAPIPDEPGTVAFFDGPVVLAGLCDREVALTGDPATLLAPDDERHWGYWNAGWRTVGQPTNLRFRPLHTITDEAYTVYFPLRDVTA